uniref:GAF domain-containing protein n=1 Tax=Dietzia sp. SYD-A1 TaxID=2780141 RepID=UPI0035C7C1E6
MTQTVHSPSVAPDEDPVDLSWRRSASCGLTPKSARPGAPDPLASRSHRLAEAARPVMDDLDDVLKDTGAMLLLADREGRVIRSVRDSTRIARMLLKRGVDDGATLTEDAVGNNGIGTALETRAGVFIHGEQHFAEVLRDFACYGHPIIDPLTRRLVGAVDLTGMSADASRMFAPFVRKIVADIEARYVDTARADDRELWRRFVERTRSSDTATCAFGDEVVLASHSSLERLDSRDLARLRRLAEQDELADAVELSVGTVRVLSSRVGRRGHLLDLTFPDQHPTPTPGTSSPPGHTSTRGVASTRGRTSGRAAASPPGPEPRVGAGNDAGGED